MAGYLLFLVGLIGLTVLVTELLKQAAHTKSAGLFPCRVCGQAMRELPFSWAHRLPFEVWSIIARYNLKPQFVRRFLCPGHTISWYLPQFGERKCDVLVTKALTK